MLGSKLGDGAEREHLAVARVHRHERAGVGRFAAGLRVFDAFAERLFALLLQPAGRASAQAVARAGGRVGASLLGTGSPCALTSHALDARFAAQVAVVVVLEAFLADDRALPDAAEGAQLELGFG